MFACVGVYVMSKYIWVFMQVCKGECTYACEHMEATGSCEVSTSKAPRHGAIPALCRERLSSQLYFTFRFLFDFAGTEH